MANTKIKLKTAILTSAFISEAKKDEILAALSSLSEKQINLILKAIEEAEEEGKKLVDDAIQTSELGENLVSDLKQAKKKLAGKARGQAEKEDRESEELILENTLNKLDEFRS